MASHLPNSAHTIPTLQTLRSRKESRSPASPSPPPLSSSCTTSSMSELGSCQSQGWALLALLFSHSGKSPELKWHLLREAFPDHPCPKWPLQGCYYGVTPSVGLGLAASASPSNLSEMQIHRHPLQPTNIWERGPGNLQAPRQVIPGPFSSCRTAALSHCLLLMSPEHPAQLENIPFVISFCCPSAPSPNISSRKQALRCPGHCYTSSA